MTASQILIFSLCLGAVSIGLWSATLVWRVWRSEKAGVHLEGALKGHAEDRARPSLSPAVDASLNSRDASEDLGQALPAWFKGRWIRPLLADEDRVLLDQAGIGLAEGAPVYVVSRVILAGLLPLVAINFMHLHGMKTLMAVFFGIALGLMLPKWIVQSMAKKRRRRIGEELPLFVDMLRLLQGVGLSVDQSLHILAHEFGRVLKVIGFELGLANRLYATGRSREQSFQRLIALSGDEDMVAVVNLLVQVDKHGGAVQEPLAQFAQRLRERRQAEFKEKIGKITVKMTAVMVLTLLPALIVITAGPGFMAVMRSLSSIK